MKNRSSRMCRRHGKGSGKIVLSLCIALGLSVSTYAAESDDILLEDELLLLEDLTEEPELQEPVAETMVTEEPALVEETPVVEAPVEAELTPVAEETAVAEEIPVIAEDVPVEAEPTPVAEEIPVVTEDVPVEVVEEAGPTEEEIQQQIQQQTDEIGFEVSEEMAEQYLHAEAWYQQALARYRKNQYVKADEAIQEALAIYPGHRPARKLASDIGAHLGKRRSLVESHAAMLRDQSLVDKQEAEVRIANLIADGDRFLAAGSYIKARAAYDSAAISIRSGGINSNWGDLPQRIEDKIAAAESMAREADLEDRRIQARAAGQRQYDLSVIEQRVLDRKVDEILRRAGEAYHRADYRRASVLAWNAYELDRRRDDARDLYRVARRKGHVQFDDWFRQERDERLSRSSEQIHMSLIPQTELLLYPRDWFRRTLRKPVELGENTEEPWMENIRKRMEEKVSLNFEEAELLEVIDFLRGTTGVNFVVDNAVIADGDTPPISLKADGMRLKTALDWIMQLTELRQSIRNEAVFIGSEDIEGDVLLRMYDINDQVMPIRNFTGMEISFDVSGGSTADFDPFAGAVDEPEEIDSEEIREFIMNAIDPDGWDNGGKTMELDPTGTSLIVATTLEVHESIEELLATLRNQQSMQVNIQIRMLDVEKGFFEEIGVDWSALSSTGIDRFTSAVDTNLPPRRSADGFDAAFVGMRYEHAFNYAGALNLPQVNAILIAAESENDVQTSVAPEITCYNNQRANSAFITQYAYIADYDIVVGSGSVYDPNIEVLNFGTVIDVKPIISSDRKYVTLEARPTSSRLRRSPLARLVAPSFVLNNVFATLVLPFELPETEIRALRSTVMLPDKGSLIIGGLGNGLRQRSHTGVPLLSHIPFLGRFFGRNGVYDSNRQLYYIMTAEIIDLSEREAAAPTGEHLGALHQ